MKICAIKSKVSVLNIKQTPWNAGIMDQEICMFNFLIFICELIFKARNWPIKILLNHKLQLKSNGNNHENVNVFNSLC